VLKSVKNFATLFGHVWLSHRGQGTHGVIVGPNTDGVTLEQNEIRDLYEVDDAWSYTPAGVIIWGDSSGDAQNTDVLDNLVFNLENDDTGVAPRGLQFSCDVWGGTMDNNKIYNIVSGSVDYTPWLSGSFELTSPCKDGVSISKEQDFVDRGDGTVYPGDTISYLITVENFFDTVVDLMIQDALTGYAKYVSGSLQGDVSGTPVGVDESFISGALLGYTLNWGEILTISFVVDVLNDAPIGSIIKNTATVSYLDREGSTIEKSASVQVEVVPEPATIVLIGIGLFGVFALARRRRRQKK